MVGETLVCAFCEGVGIGGLGYPSEKIPMGAIIGLAANDDDDGIHESVVVSSCVLLA